MNNHKSDILHHEKILSIIKELEQNPAITQRANLFGKLAVAVRFIALTRRRHKELVKEFPHLSLSAIYDALSYYYDHTDEIERLMEKNREDQRKKKEQVFCGLPGIFP